MAMEIAWGVDDVEGRMACTLPRVRFLVFFFFQAEDGIRDYKVTGVQTCALPISPTTAAPAPAPPSRPTPPAPAPAWDPVQLRQRLASQSPRMQHAIEGFAQDFADAPQQLRRAARSGNWATVASLAHTFKGSLGYLGANLLEQWSAMAETGAHACMSGDGKGGNARPSGDLPSLVQALADGLRSEEHTS